MAGAAPIALGLLATGISAANTYRAGRQEKYESGLQAQIAELQAEQNAIQIMRRANNLAGARLARAAGIGGGLGTSAENQIDRIYRRRADNADLARLSGTVRAGGFRARGSAAQQAGLWGAFGTLARGGGRAFEIYNEGKRAPAPKTKTTTGWR